MSPEKESKHFEAGEVVSCASPPTRLFLHEGEKKFKMIDFPPAEFSDFCHDLAFAVVSALEDRGIRPPDTAIKEVVDNLIHALPCHVSVVIYPEMGFVSISDTGRGIPDLSLAMQPGYSTAGSQERKYIRGAGLGFLLASLDLEEKGGALRVESREGVGTYVRLDLLPGVFRREPSQDASWLTVRKLNILTLLAEHGPLTVPALASKLGVSLSTAYRDVRELLKEGLLLRDPSGKLFLSHLGRRYLRTLSGL